MKAPWFYSVLGLAVVSALFPAAPAAAQQVSDVIYLQDGRERVGELLTITSDSVIFMVDGESEASTFALVDVQRLDLSRQREGDEARSVEELDDPLLKRVLESAPRKYDYPDSGHVVLYELKEYKLGADGSFTRRERRIEKVFLERGKRRANVARYYKKGEETLDIDFARTIDPDGSLTPISDAAVDITSVNADTPEYEKLYQAKFAMKQVKEDSVLDFQVTTHRAETDLLYPFYAIGLFRDREPILESELRIIVPPGIELAYQADRLGENIEFSKEDTEEGVVYRWVGKNCPRVVPEPMMPPAGDLYPRVTAAVKTTWEAVGEAYAKAAAKSDTPSEAIKAKVSELTSGITDPQEKAERVFNYFTEEIRQLWVNPDEYSYTPRPVREVFERLAGNTTDKALLLAIMLREAGLPAQVVLSCPQGNGKLIEQVPCIRQLDDALVAVTLPTGRRFLSLDNDSVRFGQMPAEYQGTRGLLASSDGIELVTIPMNAPEEEMSATAYRMKIGLNGDLMVTKSVTVTGNDEVYLRSAWKNQKDEELRRALEVALTGLHPKSHLDSYEVKNLRDLTKPVEFTETYTLKDYAMRAGDDLLVFRLPEIEYSAAAVGKPDREFPLRWSLRRKEATDVTLEIPPGFKVYYAGKDFEADAGVASFTARFAASDGVVRYRDSFVQSETEAPREAYADYKACLETRARVSKEWIVLERAEE